MAISAGALAAIYGGSALLGGMSSFMGGRSVARAEERRRAMLRQANRMLKAGKIMGVAQQLSPMIREQILSALGPQFQSAVASNVARRGLTGSGLGLALQNAAIAAPGIAAQQQSLGTAMQIQQARANALIGGAGMIQPQPNALAMGLQGAVSGGLTAALVGQMLGLGGGTQGSPLMPQQPMPWTNPNQDFDPTIP